MNNSPKETVWRFAQEIEEVSFFDKGNALENLMSKMTLSDLLEFQMGLYEIMESFVNVDHICSCYLFREGVVGYDDFFSYVSDLAMCPKNKYLDILNNPDLILDFGDLCSYLIEDDGQMFSAVPNQIGIEVFGQAWRSAYDLLEGEVIDPDAVVHNDKTGFGIVSEKLCKQRTPRLYHRFGEDCF